MTSPDLLHELRKVYAEELATQWAKDSTQRTDLAMLAVYERGRRDGATQQRAMLPTIAMHNNAAQILSFPGLSVREDGAVILEYRVPDPSAIFTAMQRVAPLVTDSVDSQD